MSRCPRSWKRSVFFILPGQNNLGRRFLYHVEQPGQCEVKSSARIDGSVHHSIPSGAARLSMTVIIPSSCILSQHAQLNHSSVLLPLRRWYPKLQSKTTTQICTNTPPLKAFRLGFVIQSPTDLRPRAKSGRNSTHTTTLARECVGKYRQYLDYSSSPRRRMPSKRTWRPSIKILSKISHFLSQL